MTKYKFILKKKGKNQYYCSLNNNDFTSNIDKADRFTKKQAEKELYQNKGTTMYCPITNNELEIKEIQIIIVK